MRYPYMTFDDETEVTHSKMGKDGTVRVSIETPTGDGFKSLLFTLPGGDWVNRGYSDNEVKHWKAFMQNNAHLIMESARTKSTDD